MEWQEEFECEEFLEIPQKTEKETLPAKSKKRYEFAYGRFKEWIKSHGINVISENVLLKYFYELSTTHKYSPPTLWNLYSMLNTTIKIFDNVDIEKYGKLLAFLKRKNVGYKAKQSKVFKATEIKRFLMEAPDNRYLLTKVAMIFGVAGGCRKGELPNVTINDIQELDGVLVVEMPETKTNIPRSFTIDEPFVTYVKMYLALRPPNVPTDRFFLNYQKGRCTVQVVGINKFGGMPKEVATFLGLKEPHLYTGHAFRRTSATLLANAGPSIISMQKPERWKSTQDEEGLLGLI
ncbi:hypothetical protein ABEB36_000498 [Hypothenemus hampei]|uniref:Tyr recombinase domain-containing protein n=1 Tax=Hypothenemus hampei TaxID=57062 RepID=A0ABD1FBE6_HYPHA